MVNRRYFLLGAIVGLLAFTAASAFFAAGGTGGAYHAGAGVQYDATPGPNVTLEQSAQIANANSFPSPHTVRFAFARSGVALSITSQGTPSVYLTSISGQAVAASVAGGRPTEFVVAGSHPVIVGPHVSTVRVATGIALSDHSTDFSYNASRPVQVTVLGLPAGVRVQAVTSRGRTLATTAVDGSGRLTYTLPAGAYAISLRAIGGGGGGGGGGGIGGGNGLTIFGIHLPISGGLLGIILAILAAAGYYAYKRLQKKGSKSKHVTGQSTSKSKSKH